MSAAVETGSPPRLRPGAFGSAVLIVGVGLATVAAAFVGSASPFLALLPVLMLAAAFAVTRVPLRWSALGLLTLLLTLDVSSDAAGLWHSPFVMLGDILRDNLDRFIPGLKLNGLEVILVGLACVWLHRRYTGSRVDSAGQLGTPRVIRDLVLLYLAGLAYAEVYGIARGQGVAIWKLRNNLHVIVFFVLFAVSFRGPVDFAAIARVIVAAAIVKSALAVWIQSFVAPARTGGELAYATNHGDSILFAVAVVILLAELLERPDGRTRARAALLLPPIVWGMVANGRRLAWVILAMTFVTTYMITPMRPWKRRFHQIVLVTIPIGALYVGAGWSSSAGVFAPVQMLRSLSDSTVDRSTLWREVENWNISMSLRESPFLGIGLGGEYTEYMQNDDISMFYPDFRGWPHNSVLGLLLLAGVFAFTAMWSLFAITVYLAVRSYHLSRDPECRVAALASIAATISCMTVAYGDTGANLIQYRLFWALALVAVAKISLVTGAWPGQRAAVPAGAGRA